MGLSIIAWREVLGDSKYDNKVNIKIATLLEDEIEKRGTYITEIAPRTQITAHYHQHGAEDYHIISGSGVIRIVPLQNEGKSFKLICKPVAAGTSFSIPPNVIHQLVNTGDEPLTLIFSCPITHLGSDRIVVDDLEGFIHV